MNTFVKRLLLTVIGTPAAALAVWALSVPVAGRALTVRMGGGTQSVGPVSVVAVSLLAGLAGWALLAVLERFASRPDRIWTIVALVVLACLCSARSAAPSASPRRSCWSCRTWWSAPCSFWDWCGDEPGA
jgi:Family of unknown function (DUF6069)